MAWKPDYITGVQLAAYVRAAADDAYVAGLATAASRAVDGACHRQFGQLAEPAVRYYPRAGVVYLPNRCRWLVRTEDFQDTTDMVVEVDGQAVAAGVDGYQLWPRNAAADGVPYTGITLATAPAGDVDATVRWGWSAVPAAVVQACYLQGNRWHVRRASPYGTAGSTQDGSTTSLTARLDPDVRGMLSAAGLIRLERAA